MSKKHIALVSVDTFDPNLTEGGSRSTFEVMRYLREKRSEISVFSYYSLPRYRMARDVTSSDSGGTPERENHNCRVPGIRLLEEQMPFEVNRPLGNPATIKHIVKALEGEDIDLIVTLGEDINAILVSCILDIRGVHFFNSFANVMFYRAVSPIYVGLLKKKKVLTSSAFLRDSARDVLGIDAGLWFSRIEYPLARRTSLPESRIVGFYSSGGEIKGEEIVRRLVDAMPEVHFITAGYQLYRTVTGSHAPVNLSHMGWIEDMDRFYERIGVLVVPSLVEEGFSRVILEASMRGIPVIANHVGGIPEAIGDSGILVDVDLARGPNIEKLTQTYKTHIEHLLGDRGLYESCQEKALNRAEAYRELQERNSQEIYEKYFA